ncbi:MAG TPA: tetratricopeptide repeat protein [Thermoanaerobaculia bacterium]|nr:tetratricopeptide repeat protein [Thermoanaerobaculia bacterium]
MILIYLLIVCAYTFLCIAAILAILLSASFTERQRQRFPLIRHFEGKHLTLGFTIAISLIAGYVSYTLKDILILKASVEPGRGPGSSQTEKASLSGFEYEIVAASAARAADAVAYFQLGDEAFRSQRFADAATAYSKSISLVESQSADLNLGISLRYLSNFDEAIPVLQRALQASPTASTELVHANCVFQLGSIYLIVGRGPEGLPLIKKAREMFRRKGDSLGNANATFNLGTYAYTTGNSREAEELYREAERYYALANNSLGRGNVLNNIGIAQFDAGKMLQALGTLQSALAMYRDAGSGAGEGRAYVNIGNVEVDIGRPQEAVLSFQNALNAARRIGDRDLEAGAQTALAGAYSDQGRASDALKAATEALGISESINNKLAQGWAHTALIEADRESRQYDEALEHGRKALESFGGREVRGSIEARVEIGKVLVEINRLGAAEEEFTTALSDSEKEQYRIESARSLLGLANIALRRGGQGDARSLLLRAQAIYGSADINNSESREVAHRLGVDTNH